MAGLSKGDLADVRSVLFVCLGNICRSPLAEATFRAEAENAGLADQLLIDSAGTGGWHAGSLPDERSIEVAMRHGLDITDQRARQVTADDFAEFDLILAMDRANEQTLKARKPSGSTAQIHLFLDLVEGRRADIPDPYYGGEDGFEAVYRKLLDGNSTLVRALMADRRSISG